MNIDELRVILEESGLETDKIDEIMTSMGGLEEKIANIPQDGAREQIEALREALEGESDWKKRAALAAKMISINLSTY